MQLYDYITSENEKINVEGQMLNDKLLVKYFVIQQIVNVICLICHNKIASLKEFNIKQNYNSLYSKQ